VRITSLVVLLVPMLGACARAHPHLVLVNTSPNPGYQVNRTHTFCIDPGHHTRAAEAPGRQHRSDELTAICVREARGKGLKLTAASDPTANDCVHTRLDWSVSGPNGTPPAMEAQAPAAPPPPRVSGKRRRPEFSKSLRLTARNPDGTVVVDGSAAMWSRNPVFTDTTAEVLCRALLHEFPARIDAKSYDVLPR
jgi:hypothetical protein